MGSKDSRSGQSADRLGRIITSSACIDEGARWLCAREPRFQPVYERAAPLATRLRPGGFTALLRAIISQQLSVAAAASISARLEAAKLTEPRSLSAADDETLRNLGLSRQKIRYVRALIAANIDYDGLNTAANSEIIATLTAVSGIGVWTAEIYAMFSLGRADIFPAGDLALQESLRHMFGLENRPKEKQAREIARDWKPWRAVAARLCWAHYRLIKEKEGVL